MQEKKTLPHPLCSGDIVLYVILIFCVLLSALLLFLAGTPTAASTVVSVRCGDAISYYPIDKDNTFTLHSHDFELTVTIKDGTVSVTSATCPDLVCVSTPALTARGGAIACVPADVLITVTNGKGDKEDADIVIG